ncbi:helix-turn-helix domain-containing protein [Sphingobium nicotianae]|uniref:Helix-turn-helix domain-containing protein n=1 Tax=Sphingobium nicotianae TaxID=2782607 RepID=A0A9X1DAL0_9SPHN|nr:helix-turn-helix domain-containing protein [Sphingobium nicotianae]MBT2186505.1 helix-turn-helix domain-containing protein [Sphingobium nicotianae]
MSEQGQNRTMVEVHRVPPTPKASRSRMWTDLYSEHVDRAATSLGDAEHCPAITIAQLGSVAMIRLDLAAGTIQRTAEQIGYVAEPTYAFLLQVSGTASFSHYGQDSVLAPGDFTLCNNAVPYVYASDGPADLLMIRAGAGTIREHLPSPEQFCGRHLRADEGLSESAAQLCLGVCEQLASGLPEAVHNRVARNLLDAIATAFAISFDGLITASAVLTGRHARVRLFIEENLRDPDLSPGLIATRLKLSSRYLRMIFASGDETASAYVLRRRLEECARQMADPASAHLTITDIAFGWGFNSAPHFARSFRERFGQAPRVYRREKLGVGMPLRAVGAEAG